MPTKKTPPKKPRTLSKIEDLKPAPYNPRTITEKAANGLGKSIEKFGDIAGITWNAKTGHLVCGHQRVEQLKAQGAKFKDGALVLPSGERFPIRVVNWTLNQEKAANVGANNKHIAGDFTDELASVLSSIKSEISTEDFEIMGFDLLEPNDFDPEKEWKGMPSYDNENKLSHNPLIVNFQDEKGREDFAKLVGCKMTAKTKFIWFPEEAGERADVKNKRYVGGK